MSYFMNNGAKVAQAAAGLGAAAMMARPGTGGQFCNLTVTFFGPWEQWSGSVAASMAKEIGHAIAERASAGASPYRSGPTILVRGTSVCGDRSETKEWHVRDYWRDPLRALLRKAMGEYAVHYGPTAPTTPSSPPHLSGLGALTLPHQPGYAQASANGLGAFGAVAETPSVVGGDLVNVFRDGIFAEGKESADYGELTNVFNDGIFGGSIRSGLGAAGASLDLRSPAVLRQVKMMIRSIDPNLPVADIDVPWWTLDTENSWHTAVYATAIKTNTPPEAASTWNQKVGGHDVPTTQGLYAVFGYAVQGVAPNYAETYWPDLAAFVKGGGSAIHAPRTSAGGMTTAKMVGFGAAAAGVVLAGLFLMKHRRRGAVAA